MSKYPKIGIRPVIDGRRGGIRESLEGKTMAMAEKLAELRGISVEEAQRATFENGKRLYRID